jgi:hypothetical protein
MAARRDSAQAQGGAHADRPRCRFDFGHLREPSWRALRSHPLAGARKLAKLPFWIAVAFPNYQKHLRREKIYDGFAYVNDGGENYGLLTCYVSTGRQLEVVKRVGYRHVTVLQPWLANQPAGFNYFVCTPAELTSAAARARGNCSEGRGPVVSAHRFQRANPDSSVTQADVMGDERAPNLRGSLDRSHHDYAGPVFSKERHATANRKYAAIRRASNRRRSVRDESLAKCLQTLQTR